MTTWNVKRVAGRVGTLAILIIGAGAARARGGTPASGR